MVTQIEIDQANAQAQEQRNANPMAIAARYDRRVSRVVVCLSNGLEVSFKPHDAQGLETAKPADLSEIEISPSGFGLHFPKLDADLYLPALLKGVFGTKQWIDSKKVKQAA
jgi:hypothetical protein